MRSGSPTIVYVSLLSLSMLLLLSPLWCISRRLDLAHAFCPAILSKCIRQARADQPIDMIFISRMADSNKFFDNLIASFTLETMIVRICWRP